MQYKMQYKMHLRGLKLPHFCSRDADNYHEGYIDAPVGEKEIRTQERVFTFFNIEIPSTAPHSPMKIGSINLLVGAISASR